MALPYGEQLVADVVNRTETAMPQAHCFLATELVLKAQQQAQRVKLDAVLNAAADELRLSG